MSIPLQVPVVDLVPSNESAPITLSPARGAYAVANGVLTLAFGLLTFISIKLLITKKLSTLRQRLFFIFIALACVGTLLARLEPAFPPWLAALVEVAVKGDSLRNLICESPFPFSTDFRLS